MKTAVLTGVRQIELRVLPDLVPPDDGLVLQVAACGVCGSDLRRWREGPPPGVASIQPGHEIAGMVVAAGPHMSRFAVGDRLAVAPDIQYQPDHHAAALDLLASGAIPTGRLVTHSLPLDAVAEAYRVADSGEALKVMVTP
jgi:threonine dehydrogenase-like Zn-dependent dehydrogenase